MRLVMMTVLTIIGFPFILLGVAFNIGWSFFCYGYELFEFFIEEDS